MFGKTIDYRLLRPLVHSRHPEAEELRQVERDLGIESAMARFEKWNSRLDNAIPIEPALRYLDVGCGMGEMCLALAQQGCRHLTGIDKDSYYIEIAQDCARELQLQDQVAFECANVHDLPSGQQYDIVLSHEMLEHVERPRDFLRRIDALLQSKVGGGERDGRIIIGFGPLFHSPIGDHLNRFFKFRIPWGGILFSEAALMRLRRECWQPVADEAEAFEDMREGLNKMKYSEFLRYVKEMGWQTERLIVNPQLKRWPALWRLSNLVLRVPWLRDYFAVSVYAIYRRP